MSQSKTLVAHIKSRQDLQENLFYASASCAGKKMSFAVNMGPSIETEFHTVFDGLDPARGISGGKLLNWFSKGYAVAGQPAVGTPQIPDYDYPDDFMTLYDHAHSNVGSNYVLPGYGPGRPSAPTGYEEHEYVSSGTARGSFFSKNPRAAYCGTVPACYCNRNLLWSAPLLVKNGVTVQNLDGSWDVYDIELLNYHKIGVLRSMEWGYNKTLGHNDVPTYHFSIHHMHYEYGSNIKPQSAIFIGRGKHFLSRYDVETAETRIDFPVAGRSYTSARDAFGPTFPVTPITAYRGSLLVDFEVIGIPDGIFVQGAESNVSSSTLWEADSKLLKDLFVSEDDVDLSEIASVSSRIYDKDQWRDYSGIFPLSKLDRSDFKNISVGDTTMGKLVDFANERCRLRKPMRSFGFMRTTSVDQADVVIMINISHLIMKCVNGEVPDFRYALSDQPIGGEQLEEWFSTSFPDRDDVKVEVNRSFSTEQIAQLITMRDIVDADEEPAEFDALSTRIVNAQHYLFLADQIPTVSMAFLPAQISLGHLMAMGSKDGVSLSASAMTAFADICGEWGGNAETSFVFEKGDSNINHFPALSMAEYPAVVDEHGSPDYSVRVAAPVPWTM